VVRGLRFVGDAIFEVGVAFLDSVHRSLPFWKLEYVDPVSHLTLLVLNGGFVAVRDFIGVGTRAEEEHDREVAEALDAKFLQEQHDREVGEAVMADWLSGATSMAKPTPRTSIRQMRAGL
jgi:hypothetical protein